MSSEHIWLCWSYAGAPASHKTVPRTTNWRYINMLCSESFHMASSAAPVTALVKPQNLKLRLCIWQQGSLFLILSYPGLFKNIPHVWFLRLYSCLKNLQHDFPKMMGGGSKAVWNFSENSSVLVRTCFPKAYTFSAMEQLQQQNIHLASLSYPYYSVQSTVKTEINWSYKKSKVDMVEIVDMVPFPYDLNSDIAVCPIPLS